MNTDYIDQLRIEYIEKHTKEQIREELIQENNVEKRDIKGYHGREILELLQNADDAYQKSIDIGNIPDCDLNVEIRYLNDTLIISNTGTFFDLDGIKAIVQGNNSPKKGKYIGNKGTGFRSILNWANAVRIFSGEFAIEFSKEIALELFNSIKTSPQIQKQYSHEPTLYIPMLAVPRNIEHNRPHDKTTIEIEINPETLNDDYTVEKQLNDIDLRILLFLPNVSQICITTESGKIEYRRSISNSNVHEKIKTYDVQLVKIVNSEIQNQEQYRLFHKTISQAIVEDDVNKDIQLSIAVPEDENTVIKHLYSYFPLLDSESPFNCVLHATYSLGDHRNNIVLSTINKKVVIAQLDFLIEVANFYVLQRQLSDAYRILLPSNYRPYYDWKFPSSFSQFGLEEYYIKQVEKQPIFETVNHTLLSMSDHPKVITDVFPRVFRKKPFAKLLKIQNSKIWHDLISLLSSKLKRSTSYSSDELCNAINNLSEQWDVSDQVKVFIWWNLKTDFENLPRLLKTQDKKWLHYQDDCYFLEGNFDSIKLPRWVKVKALAQNYTDSLVNQANSKVPEIKEHSNDKESGHRASPVRIICQNEIFRCINFKYRDKSNIIPAINTSVTTFKRAVDFVNWLWVHYGNTQSDVQRSNEVLRFPTKSLEVYSSDKIYLGKEYGPSFVSKLFSSDYKEFSEPSLFGIEDKDLIDFKNFLRRFGIHEYPKITVGDVENPLKEFDSKMKKEIYDSGLFQGTSSTYIQYCIYHIPYIQNLTDILKSLSMYEILSWIHHDNDLSALLDQTYYGNSAYVKCHGYKQWDGYYKEYRGKVSNYVLTVFNTISWIEIDGDKYAPREVLICSDSKSNQKFENQLPVLKPTTIQEISHRLNLTYSDVEAIFSKFNFCKKVTDLPSSNFYGLLLRLQESINNQELYKSIYRLIEQPGFIRKFGDSSNKKLFFANGKLLVRYHGQLQYWKASESFLPSTKIINKKAFPIVDKGIRTNNSNFIRVFHCLEYDKDYTVIKGSDVDSPLNVTFQKFFTEFCAYAQAYSERNENIAKTIHTLRVRLVKSIDISENDQKLSITENYALIKESITNWYIVVSGQQYDLNTISENIENIFSNIANTPGFDAGKLGELFRASSRENREFLIRKEFGSLTVIDESSYRNELKSNFFQILKTYPSYATINADDYPIDFDHFESNENSPVLIRLFRQLKIDIQDFVKAGFVYVIDLTEYYSSAATNFIQKEKCHYKDVLFNRAQQAPQLQSNFLAAVASFEDFQVHPENSVNYDPIAVIRNRFGDWESVVCVQSSSEVYSLNFERMNPDNLFDELIANDENVQRMIYFGLDDEFSNWLDIQKSSDTRQDITPLHDPYSQFRDIVPTVTCIDYSDNNGGVNPSNGANGKHRGAFSPNKKRNQDANNKRLGNIGELLVYNLLCDKYGSDKVTPRSEAFVTLGILKPGQAVSGDYDLSYTDEHDDIHYVEVKTGHSNSFYMSVGELQFAETHSSNYHIYNVYGVDGDNPQYEILPIKFWKDSRYRKIEIIEKIMFDF